MRSRVIRSLTISMQSCSLATPIPRKDVPFLNCTPEEPLRTHALVTEVPHSGQYHRQSQSVGAFDHLTIPNRASGLDHGGCSRSGDFFYPVREWKESVGGGNGPSQGQDGLGSAKLARVDSAHLTGANTNRLSVTGVNDCVRLDVLTDLPGKDQSGYFVFTRLSLGYNRQVGRGELMNVGTLEEHAAGDLLENGTMLSWANLKQAQIVHGRKP